MKNKIKNYLIFPISHLLWLKIVSDLSVKNTKTSSSKYLQQSVSQFKIIKIWNSINIFNQLMRNLMRWIRVADGKKLKTIFNPN